MRRYGYRQILAMLVAHFRLPFCIHRSVALRTGIYDDLPYTGKYGESASQERSEEQAARELARESETGSLETVR